MAELQHLIKNIEQWAEEFQKMKRKNKMNKYFSTDIEEYPAEIKFHSTLEEARAACLSSALVTFDFACEDGSFDETAAEFHNAVYGIVLGKAEIKQRPTTKEEKEHMIDCNTGKPFEMMVESPEIIEYDNGE